MNLNRDALAANIYMDILKSKEFRDDPGYTVEEAAYNSLNAAQTFFEKAAVLDNKVADEKLEARRCTDGPCANDPIGCSKQRPIHVEDDDRRKVVSEFDPVEHFLSSLLRDIDRAKRAA